MKSITLLQQAGSEISEIILVYPLEPITFTAFDFYSCFINLKPSTQVEVLSILLYVFISLFIPKTLTIKVLSYFTRRVTMTCNCDISSKRAVVLKDLFL